MSGDERQYGWPSSGNRGLIVQRAEITWRRNFAVVGSTPPAARRDRQRRAAEPELLRGGDVARHPDACSRLHHHARTRSRWASAAEHVRVAPPVRDDPGQEVLADRAPGAVRLAPAC
jgi:hypothetical protein